MNNIKFRRIHPYTGVKSAGFFVFSEVVKYTIRGRFQHYIKVLLEIIEEILF